MIVLICGGRDFDDVDFIWTELTKLHLEKGPFTEIVHGGCRGVDTIAEDWAKTNDLSISSFPINKEVWKRLGPKAGPMRNSRMLRVGRPDLVIAFPGDICTADMVRKSKKAGVEVIKVTR